MLPKCTLVGFLLLAPIVNAWAQRPVEGFVITSSGDTIRGELSQSDKDARRQLVHIKPVGQPYTTYSAATIRGFGRAGYPLVETRTTGPNQTPILAETLAKGPLSLYKGYQAATKDVRYSPDIRYYLQFPDSAQLTLIEPSNLALSLHQLLGDCSAIDFNQRIHDQPKSYNTKQLTRIVEDYSACRLSQKPVKAKTPYRGWYTSWGVKAGLSENRLTTAEEFANLRSAKAEATTDWQVGILGNLAYWNGFSVQVEALLMRFHGSFAQPVYSGTSLYSISRKAELEFTQVRVPLLLRYQLGHGAIRPFLLAGPHVGYSISHSISIMDQRSDQDSPIARLAMGPGKGASGYQAGAGLYLALPKMPGISIDAVFSKGNQGSLMQDILYRMQEVSYRSLGLNAAMYF